MFRMPKQSWKRSSLVVCGALLGLTPLAHAEAQSGGEQPAPAAGVTSNTPGLRKPDQGNGQLRLTCLLTRPGQVHRFALSCGGTKHIDVKTADCCLPGDNWQLKVKAYDLKPNTAVATAPGEAGAFSAPARVFTFGGSRLNAVIECSYPHGINVFPAGAELLVDTHKGDCTVDDLGATDEIYLNP